VQSPPQQLRVCVLYRFAGLGTTWHEGRWADYGNTPQCDQLRLVHAMHQHAGGSKFDCAL